MGYPYRRVRKARRQSVCTWCGGLVLVGQQIAKWHGAWVHVAHVTGPLLAAGARTP